MTNTTDNSVSQTSPSSPVPPPPPPPVPSSEPPPAAAPVSGAPPTATTGIATNSGVNVGGSGSGLGIPATANIVIRFGTHARDGHSGEMNTITTAGSGVVANPSASVGGSSSFPPTLLTDENSPPRKRGSMLPGGEGRSVKPNVAPLPPLVPQEKRACAVCGRAFDTAKALFGHMNSHPNRGWKGTHPPPSFNRLEFVDLQVETEQVAADDPAPPPESPNALPDLNTLENTTPADGASAEPAAAEPVYRLPDLNLLPPSEVAEEDREE